MNYEIALDKKIAAILRGLCLLAHARASGKIENEIYQKVRQRFGRDFMVRPNYSVFGNEDSVRPNLGSVENIEIRFG